MKKLIKTFVASAAILGVFSMNEAMAESNLLDVSLLSECKSFAGYKDIQHNVQRMPLSIATDLPSLTELSPQSEERVVENTGAIRNAGYTRFDPGNKNTPLYWATLFNSKSIVRFLIWKGADGTLN